MVSLSIGPLNSVVQNVVYALPAKRCKLYCQTAGATFVQSNDPAMSASTAMTLVEGAYEVAGGFIKCTSGNVTVTLKN
jgi:hypothetical protein